MFVNSRIWTDILTTARFIYVMGWYAEQGNRKKKVCVVMTLKSNFGSKKYIIGPIFIIGVFGPKTKLHYISNVLLYTKHKSNIIKATTTIIQVVFHTLINLIQKCYTFIPKISSSIFTYNT